MVGDFIMKKKEMKNFVWKETTCASYKKKKWIRMAVWRNKKEEKENIKHNPISGMYIYGCYCTIYCFTPCKIS